MPQPWEMEWNGKELAPPAPPPSSSGGSKPWEMEWKDGALSAAKADERPRSQRIFDRLKQYPGIAWDAVKDAVTLPRDAMRGELGDLGSPEAIKAAVPRATDAATMLSPGSAGAKLARPAGLSPRMARAATTAEELGAPLPRGSVSESPVMQGITSAAQQLPIVGPKITEKIGHTIEKAGEHVTGLAEDLSGGVPDRATAGANLRPALKGAIDANNGRIDEVFKGVRGAINPDKVADLPRTRQVLDKIVADRTAAGASKPLAGLEDVENLASKGASFNGLQRARSDIGNSLDFGTANPGFNAGDLKKVYGAMSADMHNVVKDTVNPGTHPVVASAMLKAANGESSALIEGNKTLQRLLNNSTDEGLSGSVIRAAGDKGGNAKLLAQLRQQIPKEDFEQIAGLGLHELGHNPATGDFSLNKFSTGWDKMSPTAKNVLFADPAHRKMLDDIAHLGSVLKETGSTANTSHTGAAVLTGHLVEKLGHGAASLVVGDVMPMLHALGTMAGGAFLGRALAKPATAASIARWSAHAVRNTGRDVSQLRRTQSRLTRGMVLNLQNVPGFDERAVAPLLSPK
jgi:hypothetical protein